MRILLVIFVLQLQYSISSSSTSSAKFSNAAAFPEPDPFREVNEELLLPLPFLDGRSCARLVRTNSRPKTHALLRAAASAREQLSFLKRMELRTLLPYMRYLAQVERLERTPAGKHSARMLQGQVGSQGGPVAAKGEPLLRGDGVAGGPVSAVILGIVDVLSQPITAALLDRRAFLTEAGAGGAGAGPALMFRGVDLLDGGVASLQARGQHREARHWERGVRLCLTEDLGMPLSDVEFDSLLSDLRLLTEARYVLVGQRGRYGVDSAWGLDSCRALRRMAGGLLWALTGEAPALPTPLVEGGEPPELLGAGDGGMEARAGERGEGRARVAREEAVAEGCRGQ